jgi:hypothetical protein
VLHSKPLDREEWAGQVLLMGSLGARADLQDVFALHKAALVRRLPFVCGGLRHANIGRQAAKASVAKVAVKRQLVRAIFG